MNSTDSGLASAVLIFNWVDYSVFGSMLILSILIGVYYGWFKKQDTVAEYLLGGKKMGVFPVSLSLVFSHVSGVTLVGLPAEVYQFGTQYSLVLLAGVLVFFVVIHLYLPVFYPLQLNSLYEIIYLPVVIYVPALTVNQVTGMSLHIITAVISIVCIVYTSIGGLKAVVWTDALQSFFALCSIVFVLAIGMSRVGSVTELLKINEEGGRIEFFNMNPSPFERNTFWTVVIGTVFYWTSQFAVHPGAVQRFISVSTLGKAKTVMFWSSVSHFTVVTLVVVTGMVLYATYSICDPVATKMVSKPGQILPYYVTEIAIGLPGLLGLFLSGVVSAALSTVSSGLNTVAGTVYEDFAQLLLRGRSQSEVSKAFTLKIISSVIGLVCTVMVFFVEKLGTLLQVGISLSGITSGALLGLFTLGIFFPRANTKGAMVGAVVSLVGMAIVCLGAQYCTAEGLLRFPGKVTSVEGCPADFLAALGFNASARVQSYSGPGTPVVADSSVPLIFLLSYKYYCALGTLITLTVGLAVSFLTEPPDINSLDPRLFSPCVRRLLPPSRLSDSKVPPEEHKLVGVRPANLQDEKDRWNVN